MMRIAVTGRGSSGSWQIRAVQLGAALGADLLPNVTDSRVFKKYDTVIVVKRINPDNLHALHRSKTKIVWDVVDAWPQPTGNSWTKEQAMTWMKEWLSVIRPHTVVAASPRMEDDLRKLGLPEVIYVPHHYQPEARARSTVSERIEVLGYEGSIAHLGMWEAEALIWCKRNGARWQHTPKDLSELDVVLAMRWDQGYPAMHWKSNVKQANAHAWGVPGVFGLENSYLHHGCGEERWVSNETDSLAQALDSLVDPEVRQRIRSRFLQHSSEITLARVAADYWSWLCSLKF